MKVLILTSALYGTASHHLEALVTSPEIEVSMVIYNEGHVKNKKKLVVKKIRKAFRIGFIGVLNGLRIRNWYGKDLDKYCSPVNIELQCNKLNIPFYRTPSINHQKTIELFEKANVELGISLGNGYISKRLFSIPRYGMINLHHELLPDYQNAQSIIWQIYNGSDKTGFTIHKIDDRIDTGAILLKEEIPIIFRTTLADTVTFTMSELLRKSEAGLVMVLENFERYYSESLPQNGGTTYTTPSIWQFLRMKAEFLKLKKRNLQ